MRNNSGFTLIELLTYSAIFAMVSIVLTYFLSIFFRGTGTQTITAEIGNQANFVLQKIEQEISSAHSSLVLVSNKTPTNNTTTYDEEDDRPLGQPYTTLIIKKRGENNTSPPPNNAVSPVMIYRTVSGTIVIKQGNQPEVALTNPNIPATALTFTKISTPPGRDVVLIDLTLQYQSDDPRQRISRQFLLGVGKANAATFDTDLIPGSNSDRDIGAASTKWKTLFLSGDLNINGKIKWNTAPEPENSINFLKQGMINIDPPNITGNTNLTTTVTITGAQSGYRIFVTAPSDLESGLVFIGAKITAADTLSLTLRNVTASAINGAGLPWSYLIVN